MNLLELKSIIYSIKDEFNLNGVRYYNIKKNKGLFLFINKRYNNIFKSIAEIAYLIKNFDNLENIHIFCKCGNKNNFINSSIGYSNYCCCKCSNSDINKKLLTENRNLQKYGKRFVLQVDFIREKSRIKMNELYGKDYYVQTKDFKIKSENSCYKHFSTKHNWASKDPELNGQAERERKYGKKHFAQTDEYKVLWENKERTKRIVKKQYDTKEKNGTLSGSKIENKLYNIILTKFSDTIHIYKDNERYPFYCDFYIPSQDLFIELNFHWTHGLEPFNKNNLKHIEKLNLWKFKNTKFYKTAIDVWTKRDPLKLETFKKNNLNYKIFYTEKEFNDWLKVK